MTRISLGQKFQPMALSQHIFCQATQSHGHSASSASSAHSKQPRLALHWLGRGLFPTAGSPARMESNWEPQSSKKSNEAKERQTLLLLLIRFYDTLCLVPMNKVTWILKNQTPWSECSVNMYTIQLSDTLPTNTVLTISRICLPETWKMFTLIRSRRAFTRSKNHQKSPKKQTPKPACACEADQHSPNAFWQKAGLQQNEFWQNLPLSLAVAQKIPGT